MRIVFAGIRIALAVAVVNAAVRTGFVYWNFYQFQDHAHQTAIFGGRTSTDALRNIVLSKAGELQLPVTEDQVAVRRENHRTIIAANYVQPIEYLPNHNWPVKFSFEVEGFTIDGAGR